MPDRIISPPMVGVPCFSTIWRCGPSLRIGWPLPCFTLSSEMMRRPEQQDEQQGGEDRRAGARRLIAEHVEGRDFVGQAGEQVDRASVGRPCRLADELPL